MNNSSSHEQKELEPKKKKQKVSDQDYYKICTDLCGRSHSKDIGSFCSNCCEFVCSTCQKEHMESAGCSLHVAVNPVSKWNSDIGRFDSEKGIQKRELGISGRFSEYFASLTDLSEKNLKVTKVCCENSRKMDNVCASFNSDASNISSEVVSSVNEFVASHFKLNFTLPAKEQLDSELFSHMPKLILFYGLMKSSMSGKKLYLTDSADMMQLVSFDDPYICFAEKEHSSHRPEMLILSESLLNDGWNENYVHWIRITWKDKDTLKSDVLYCQLADEGFPRDTESVSVSDTSIQLRNGNIFYLFFCLEESMRYQCKGKGLLLKGGELLKDAKSVSVHHEERGTAIKYDLSV